MVRPFTIEEFKKAWLAFKLAGPHPFKIGFDCWDGIQRWLLPPGIAQGCESQLIGRSVFTLAAGTGPLNEVRTRGPHMLYEQERYVYFLERQDAVKRALEELFKVNALPRNPGHAAYDTMPKPEDFKLGARTWKSVGLSQPAADWLKTQKKIEGQLRHWERELEELEEGHV